MEAKYMTISPAMAKAWLETSRGNPRWTSKAKVVDKTTVKKIADDIKNGLWNPGNGSIAFDESGALVDGHHRLTAIVSANIPVESLVVFGVKQEGLIHIDENVVRKPHQRLSVDSILVSAANIHYFMLNGKTKKSESVEMLSKWIDEHPMAQFALDISSRGKNHPMTKNGSCVQAMTCALECDVPDKSLVRFVEVVNTGFSSGMSESPAVIIRNMFMGNVSRLQNDRIYRSRATQEAIRDFVDGTPRRQAYTGKKITYFDILVQAGDKRYLPKK